MKEKFLKIILLLLLFTACHKKNEREQTAETYRVICPIVSDTVYTKEYVADIQSLQNVEIRARVKGYLENAYVDEGQQVKKGQLLFSISSRRFKEEVAKANAAVKSAIAEAKSAEIQVKNMRMLVDEDVVSNSELEMQQSRLDAANANVESAKSSEASPNLNLSLTEIRAPFDGVLNRIPFKPGSLIDEDALLTSISDNRQVFAYFNVSEQEYLNLISQKQNEGYRQVSLIMANNVA
jgi:RND family efflux transporter MFP subunit